MSNAVSIIVQIADAQALVVKRVSDNGIHIASGAKTLATCLRSNVFDDAIAGLVLPGVTPAQVARIELHHVEAPVEFTTARGQQYFNIALYSVDNMLLGGREALKIKGDVAQALTAKLAPA